MTKEAFLALPEGEQVRKALRVMRSVVDEFGEDYCYSSPAGDTMSCACVYVANGQPSCLIAQVLFRLGWSLDRLREHNRASLSQENVLPEVQGGILRHVLMMAQRAQDGRSPWGECYRIALVQAAIALVVPIDSLQVQVEHA